MSFCMRDLRAGVRLATLSLAIVLTSLMLASWASVAKAAPVTSWGYITMSDGAELRYSLSLPSDEAGKNWPTLFDYDAYTAGTDVYPNFRQWNIGAERYARISVQPRGSGCSSGGDWNFMQQRWGTDGAEVISWIAEQEWAEGKVGMIGQSLPGITQLLVAQYAPENLVAIAPGKATPDLYRSVGRPGGIYNRQWTSVYEPRFPPFWNQSLTIANNQGDTKCAENLASHPVTGQMNQGIVANPFIDDVWWQDRDLLTGLSRIKVPMLATNGFQDDQVGSLGTIDFFRELNPENVWAVYSNGGHFAVGSAPGTWMQADGKGEKWNALYSRFFAHYLDGADNGWENTPHARILHETNMDGEPGWERRYSTFPPAEMEPVTLYAKEGNSLGLEAPAEAGQGDSYEYPRPGGDIPINFRSWSPEAADGSVTYTTPELSKDVSLAGTASLDLWLESTQVDTDIQATLSEVNARGEETYIQRGWLRFSMRKVDEGKSDETFPLQSFKREDAEQLTPGEPVLGRVLIHPFAHSFREGSRIRVTVAAPTGRTGVTGLEPIDLEGTNTILRDAEHPTSLTLPLVPGETAEGPLPTCGTVGQQPCRENAAPLPSGSIDLQPQVTPEPPEPPEPAKVANLSNLRVTPNAFRPKGNPRVFVPIGNQRRVPGPIASFRLTADTAVTIRLSRRATRRAAICKKGRLSAKRFRDRCLFQQRTGSWRRDATAGLNRFRFSGHRPNGRALPAGRYTLQASWRPEGKPAVTRSFGFTILKTRRTR